MHTSHRRDDSLTPHRLLGNYRERRAERSYTPYRPSAERSITPRGRTQVRERTQVESRQRSPRQDDSLLIEGEYNLLRKLGGIFLINFLLTFLEYKEENAFLRGRIAELTRQLDNSNDDLRDLQVKIGQVTSYNEVLAQENEDLREGLNSRRSRRRHRDESNVEAEGAILPK